MPLTRKISKYCGVSLYFPPVLDTLPTSCLAQSSFCSMQILHYLMLLHIIVPAENIFLVFCAFELPSNIRSDPRRSKSHVDNYFNHAFAHSCRSAPILCSKHRAHIAVFARFFHYTRSFSVLIYYVVRNILRCCVLFESNTQISLVL